MTEKKTEFIKTNDAAEMLGLKPGTLEIWRVYGKGPAFVKFGRAVRYRVSDLETWISESMTQEEKPVESICDSDTSDPEAVQSLREEIDRLSVELMRERDKNIYLKKERSVLFSMMLATEKSFLKTESMFSEIYKTLAKEEGE